MTYLLISHQPEVIWFMAHELIVLDKEIMPDWILIACTAPGLGEIFIPIVKNCDLGRIIAFMMSWDHTLIVSYPGRIDFMQTRHLS